LFTSPQLVTTLQYLQRTAMTSTPPPHTTHPANGTSTIRPHYLSRHPRLHPGEKPASKRREEQYYYSSLSPTPAMSWYVDLTGYLVAPCMWPFQVASYATNNNHGCSAAANTWKTSAQLQPGSFSTTCSDETLSGA
jgi:hypothetical protein